MLIITTKKEPFVQWLGGKRKLLKELKNLAPKEFNTYYEPFLGGGALFLNLNPSRAVINDYNSELMNTWVVVKNNLNDLIDLLIKHKKNDCKEYYLKLRSADRDGRIFKMSNTERAARFIYINRNGFGGLWRVNKKGQCNVPYAGHKSFTLIPETLPNVSNYLHSKNILIRNCDYKEALEDVKENDFVYFDPPYIPLNITSNFVNYTDKGFNLINQKELSEFIKKLSKKGVKVMISNSDTPLTHELYKDSVFNIHKIQVNRTISYKTNNKSANEVIITNY